MKTVRITLDGDTKLEHIAKFPADKDMWVDVRFQPNDTIRKLYATREVVIDDQKIKLTSVVSPHEGYFMYDMILRNGFTSALEIGMANGLSSLYMTEALRAVGPKARLTSIDPNQSTQWKSAGITNLERAGVTEHRLIEEPDYVALPQLLAAGEQFDLIFIDGMHLFDYTLLDAFYANLLCKKNGVIIIDDIMHYGPMAVIKYIDSNYGSWRRIKAMPTRTMAAYVKTGDDTREWNFHA